MPNARNFRNAHSRLPMGLNETEKTFVHSAERLLTVSSAHRDAGITLSSEKRSDREKQQDLKDDDSGQITENRVNNTSADDGRNPAEHHDAQLSADIHFAYLPPSSFVIRNRMGDHFSTIMAIPMPPPMHMLTIPV